MNKQKGRLIDEGLDRSIIRLRKCGVDDVGGGDGDGQHVTEVIQARFHLTAKCWLSYW